MNNKDDAFLCRCSLHADGKDVPFCDGCENHKKLNNLGYPKGWIPSFNNGVQTFFHSKVLYDGKRPELSGVQIIYQGENIFIHTRLGLFKLSYKLEETKDILLLLEWFKLNPKGLETIFEINNE